VWRLPPGARTTLSYRYGKIQGLEKTCQARIHQAAVPALSETVRKNSIRALAPEAAKQATRHDPKRLSKANNRGQIDEGEAALPWISFSPRFFLVSSFPIHTGWGFGNELRVATPRRIGSIQENAAGRRSSAIIVKDRLRYDDFLFRPIT